MEMVGEGAVGPIVAHTVVLEETLYHKTGPGPGGRYIHAVRGDGATATRSISSHPGALTMQRTLVFPSGERVTLDEVRELKSTVFDPMRLPLLRDPDKNCVFSRQGRPVNDGVLVGRETLKGRQVVQLRSSVFAKWLAIDAGCALVRLKRGTSDSQGGIQEAVELRVGEPDVELFRVPDHYREVLPSLLHQVAGDSDYGRRIDSYYRKHHR
jgi:hypothetical protein